MNTPNPEKRVQEKLLDVGETLTLAKAIQIGQQCELSQKPMLAISEEDDPIVHVIDKHFDVKNKPTECTTKKS